MDSVRGPGVRNGSSPVQGKRESQEGRSHASSTSQSTLVAQSVGYGPPIGAASLEREVTSEHKPVLMSSLSIWGVLARFWRILVQGIGQVYVKQVGSNALLMNRWRGALRRFLAVFANFSVFAEAASQAYSTTLGLSTSKLRFLFFIKMPEDPAGRGEVSSPSLSPR
jgi:TM2 domain-containing membrane protein YozV